MWSEIIALAPCHSLWERSRLSFICACGESWHRMHSHEIKIMRSLDIVVFCETPLQHEHICTYLLCCSTHNSSHTLILYFLSIFSKLPSWARAVVPKIFYVTEKAWNYYPYTITGKDQRSDYWLMLLGEFSSSSEAPSSILSHRYLVSLIIPVEVHVIFPSSIDWYQEIKIIEYG